MTDDRVMYAMVGAIEAGKGLRAALAAGIEAFVTFDGEVRQIIRRFRRPSRGMRRHIRMVKSRDRARGSAGRSTR